MTGCDQQQKDNPKIPLTDITSNQSNEVGLVAVEGMSDILLIASGKGGVGKSTVTVNLAASLHQQGFKVGILDADLYGPSIARMLGTGEGLRSDERGIAEPIDCQGIFVLSVASVLPPEASLVWKGPLISQTLIQMFREVRWPELDVLLVDLPPGTGDIQLTILEQFPISGALVVTTPQQLAVTDAHRAVSMFHELDIPVFGLVENMDGYICPCCGERQALYPSGSAKKLAAERSVVHLGGIPLDPAVQALADQGQILVSAQPDGITSQVFNNLATQVSACLTKEKKFREHMMRESARGNNSSHADFWEPLLDE